MAAVPGNGAGLAMSTYIEPWSSNAGGCHRPPPELTLVSPHSEAGTVANFHFVAPVAPSSANRTPWPLPL